jgi:hypothetical protein
MKMVGELSTGSKEVIRRVSFENIMKLDQYNMIIRDYNTDTEYSGYFTKDKVDKDTIPDGWYVYEFRSDRFGVIERIENQDVVIGFAGSFVTNTKINNFMIHKKSFFEWLDYGYSYLKVPEIGNITDNITWDAKVV